MSISTHPRHALALFLAAVVLFAPIGIAPAEASPDDDGIEDVQENCSREANPGQEDSDGDSTGDACEEATGTPCTKVSAPNALPESVNYFHRSGVPGSDINQLDVIASEPSFDEQAPKADRPALSVDPAGTSNGPGGPYDAQWTGTIAGAAGSIRCLTLDLWQKNAFGESLFGTADYAVTVWVGPLKEYDLGVLSVEGSGEAISHIRGALATMVDRGNTVALNIPVAAGEPVTISLQDSWLGGHAVILYDASDYDSGFTINEGRRGRRADGGSTNVDQRLYGAKWSDGRSTNVDQRRIELLTSC